jgi:hypothetical protein
MKFSEIAPPGREKQVKKLKKKFDDPSAPYAIAWAQHNKHGKPKKKESIGSSEYSEVKAILDKHGIKSSEEIEIGTEAYEELFGYYMDSGEMPYGVMKARTGMPDEWIADRLDDLGLGEQVDYKTVDRFHKKLDKLVHKTFGHSSDEKKENIEVEENNMSTGTVAYGKKGKTRRATGINDNPYSHNEGEDHPALVNAALWNMKDIYQQIMAGEEIEEDDMFSYGDVLQYLDMSGIPGYEFYEDFIDTVSTAVSQAQPGGFAGQGDAVLVDKKFAPKIKTLYQQFKAATAKIKGVKEVDEGSLDQFRNLYKKSIGSDDAAVTLRELIQAINDDSLWSDQFPQLKQFTGVSPQSGSRIVTAKKIPGDSADEKISALVQVIDDDEWVNDTAKHLMKSFTLGEDDNIEEAPFGKAVKSALGRAVNKAGTKVKKAVGSVPGLSDLKTSAKAQQNITQIADKTWQEFLQYKQSNPTDDQMKKWFKDRGMEIDSPDQANKDTVIQGVKAGIAQAGGGPAKASQDQTQQKDKFNLSQLQKIEPTATPKTIRAIAQAKAGKTVQGELAVAMQPLMTKFANALQNPTKRQRLAVALAESLSQSDLSKLDMLAREGMVPKNRVARFKTAMRTLAKGKDLPISYKDDVIEVVMKLAKIITKPSVMGMVRKGLKEEHKKTAQEKFKTWVNQANDIIS